MAGKILKAGTIPIILGVEHTVATAGTMAIDNTLKGKYGFISFDTHLDCESEVGGNKWNHGSHVARAVELKAFSGENMALIGMRGTVNSKRAFRFAKDNGITVFAMRQTVDIGVKEAAEQALRIATRETDGFYLSLDMDVLEVSATPGTETPTPFGLTNRKMIIAFLPKFGLSDKLRAFDVNEIAPIYDPSGITATTAVTFIVELLPARASIM